MKRQRSVLVVTFHTTCDTLLVVQPETLKRNCMVFFKFSAVQFREPVPTAASDSCSWLTGVEVDVVF